MAISLIIYLLLLQVLVPVYGNHGLFMGLLAFMLIRAVTLLFYFPRIEARLTREGLNNWLLLVMFQAFSVIAV